jgi:hypothetical protein
VCYGKYRHHIPQDMQKPEQSYNNALITTSIIRNGQLQELCSCHYRGTCSVYHASRELTTKKKLARRVPKRIAWAVRPMDISHFLCPDQNRIQVRGAFCDLFFPSDRQAKSSVVRLFDGAPDKSPSTSAATAAGDALSLLQLGVSGSDRGLILEAHRRYGMALKQLRKDLDETQSQAPTSDMTIAVYLLTIYAVYHSTDFASGSWSSHEVALLKLLLLGKVSADEPGSAASKFLQWRMVGMPMHALSYGLIHKRSVLFDPSKWTNALGKQTFPLTIIVLLIPGCLERLESIMKRQEGPEALAVAVQQAFDLRAEMHNCIHEFSTVAAHPPYHDVSIEQYPAFENTVKGLVYLYPSVLQFADLPTAQHARIFWTSLMVLDETLLSLPQSMVKSLQPEVKDAIAALEIEVETCVANLSRSLPYFTSLRAGTVGSLSAFETLHHVELHFRKKSVRLHVEWCCRVKDRFVPGYRIARIMARK